MAELSFSISKQESCENDVAIPKNWCYTETVKRTSVLFERGESMQNEREQMLEEIQRILRGADESQLRIVLWYIRGIR